MNGPTKFTNIANFQQEMCNDVNACVSLYNVGLQLMNT